MLADEDLDEQLLNPQQQKATSVTEIQATKQQQGNGDDG